MTWRRRSSETGEGDRLIKSPLLRARCSIMRFLRSSMLAILKSVEECWIELESHHYLRKAQIDKNPQNVHYRGDHGSRHHGWIEV